MPSHSGCHPVMALTWLSSASRAFCTREVDGVAESASPPSSPEGVFLDVPAGTSSMFSAELTDIV